MKIAIVENEFYLAQSIQNKLIETFNAKCDIFASYSEAMDVDADVFIVNSNLQGNLDNFISEKKEKIIILLAPYVTFSTVTNPINLGADDYLQKPFSIEDLIRKIVHLQEFYKLKLTSLRYKKFIEDILSDVEKVDVKKFSFPLFVKSNYKKLVDVFVYDYANNHNLEIEVVSMKKLPKNLDDNVIYYMKDFYEDNINRLLNKKAVILVDKDFKNIYPGFDMVSMNVENHYIFNDEILSVEDYIRYIIFNYQYKFTDTYLSKQIGMSRKSLWEKRKKYGIFK